MKNISLLKALTFLTMVTYPSFSTSQQSIKENKNLTFIIRKRGASSAASGISLKDILVGQPALSADPTTSDIENQKITGATEEAVPIEVKKLVSSIQEAKDVLCKAVGKNGEISFWLKASAELHVIGIGGSSESGIEVRMHCEN